MPISPEATDLAENTLRNLEADLRGLPMRDRCETLREIVRWCSTELVDEGKYLGMLEEQRQRQRARQGRVGPRPITGASKLVEEGEDVLRMRYRAATRGARQATGQSRLVTEGRPSRASSARSGAPSA